jgi:hypothetical protein
MDKDRQKQKGYRNRELNNKTKLIDQERIKGRNITKRNVKKGKR